MTAKLCLRCDWSGDTGDDVCPRCGAGLFTTGHAEVAAGPPTPETPEERPTRSWGGVAVIVLIVAFAIGAVLFVQQHTPSVATTEAASTGRPGFLLVSATADDGVRMWIWDLDAGTAVAGPLLDGVPEELVAGYELRGGWVGITTPTNSGGRVASVLRYLGPNDRPTTVVTGDRIAWAPWSPSGSTVSVERSQPAGRCFRIGIDTWFVSIRGSQPRFHGVRCGEPVAFGRDRNLPYLTIEHHGVPTTLRVGAGYTQRMLPGYRLLSVSADGDLLVQGRDGGLALAYETAFGSGPVPIGAHGDVLRPTRVLCWSADASQAFVLGTFGDVYGIYRVTMGTQPRPRPPELLMATNAVDVQATATADGGLYVLTDGAIRFLEGDQVVSVPLPTGGPPPVGSILWVSGLPYSSTEG